MSLIEYGVIQITIVKQISRGKIFETETHFAHTQVVLSLKLQLLLMQSTSFGRESSEIVSKGCVNCK